MASRKVFFVAHLLPHSLDVVRENTWSSKVWRSAGFMFHELGEGTSSWDEPWLIREIPSTFRVTYGISETLSYVHYFSVKL